MTPSLTIVIPAFNEEARLPGTLETIRLYLEGRHDLDAEILVVDDGSSDRTAELARASGARLVSYRPNRGKGHAVRRGLLAARARRALVSDADLSTPIEDLGKLERAMDEESLAMAMGSRALPDSVIPVPQGWLRRTIGKAGNLVIRAATGVPFRDTQCGFKLIDLGELGPIVGALRVDGFAWDIELCYLALLGGFPVREVPITWRNSPETKVGALDPFRVFADVWRIRRMWRRDNLPARARQPDVAGTARRALTNHEARRLREAARADSRKVVFTNGCFDLLHAGHVQYLSAARRLGDLLVVGLNDDASVTRLKGSRRPLVPFDERAELLLGLESVDAVVSFGEDTPAELIDALQPDVLVKGGDWSPERVVGRETVEKAGGRLVIVPLMEGTSTSTIVERIVERDEGDVI